jgi:hypothetical protein
MRKWWWLSFADGALPPGTQFLGACIVEASDFGEAVSSAWSHGLNPGGEVRGWEFRPDFSPKQSIRYRLLSRAEAESETLFNPDS